MITAVYAAYIYNSNTDSPNKALNGVSFKAKEGQAVCILGSNGSGKSTLAKLLNGLFTPSEGEVWVFGKNTAKDDLWEIRQTCGMVFQNPDNQIVASIVDEDIAFGLENLGVDPSEMEGRIKSALRVVGMTEFLKHSTQNLSGGQKQKIAIAGIFAMKPKCIILDEATSMLDPSGRKAVLEAVFKLKRDYGITVIMITHFIEEAALCDYVYIISDGKTAAQGEAKEVLKQGELLKSCGLEEPLSVYMERLLGLKSEVISEKELAKRIFKKYGCFHINEETAENTAEKEAVIEVKDLSYKYEGTEENALTSVSFGVPKGSFTSVIGHTGSGKSTLLRCLNGLYKPQKGEILYKGKNISQVKDIRFKVGVVFQNPDYQLFEETVLKDVMFGALNMGLSEEEAENRAFKALSLAAFPLDKADKPPFELSGGEKKRAALAGILVMQPEVLVLDEPAAGLDPKGRREILKTIKSIQKTGVTVIMVSHSMEDAAELSDYAVILKDGRVLKKGLPSEIFNDGESLRSAGLDRPKISLLKDELEKLGITLPKDCFSPKQSAEIILKNNPEQAE
ncbi:MAG: energy-coupling factor transporter ATPase [Clostridiales bacterium]|nr:energy-coupling factor transporter ATPase [Clostridiales bacterium]